MSKVVTKTEEVVGDVILIGIKDLKPNIFNPPQRVNKTTSAWKNLMHSVSKKGQIFPIAISSDNVIVNGTRRTEVAKTLGKEKIVATRLNSNSSELYDDLFVESNVSEKITGAQWAWRYLQGASVPKDIETALKNLRRVGGISCIRRIVELNKSPITFNIGIQMFRNYVGTKKKPIKRPMLRKVIYWMLYVGSGYRLKFLMGEYIPVQILINAVETKRNIMFREDGKGWTLV
tara:strand:+ start:23 stop:718 length:696 start_codon:yes stop_codon:yes gene_type:complete